MKVMCCNNGVDATLPLSMGLNEAVGRESEIHDQPDTYSETHRRNGSYLQEVDIRNVFNKHVAKPILMISAFHILSLSLKSSHLIILLLLPSVFIKINYRNKYFEAVLR